MVQRESQPSTNTSTGWWIPTFLSVVAMITGGISLYGLSQFQPIEQTPVPATQESIPTINAVAALGRLEPQGEIIHLSAPNSLDGTSTRIERFLVQEGDRVQQQQVIAILDSHNRRRAALEKAKSDVQTAEAELTKVNAGAKTGDIEAQNAEISRLEAELDNAQLEYDRYESLYQEGAVSASLRDSKQLVVKTTQKQLNQARSTLESIAEVRPEDVAVAQAELETAMTAVRQAEADLEQTYVRSPINGQILTIQTQPGEIIGNEGIVDIGQTDQMYVVAEVYETDIEKVHIGQQSIITSSAFSGKLQGEVSHIGLQVNQQEVFDVNPLADTDNKVVEVRIRLDEASSKQVAGLSNLQVQVVIQQ